MQNKCSERTERLQEDFFGRRFVGASISKITNFSGRCIEKIAEWIKRPTGFLLLVGPAGTGKTYFCSACLENLPKEVRSVRAYSETALLRKVRQSISDSSTGDYLSYLKLLLDDDLIIIDDFGASGHTEWREEVLFEAVDLRYHSKKPTIITSNLNEKEFYEIYGQRISSRIFAKENTIIDLFSCEDLRMSGL